MNNTPLCSLTGKILIFLAGTFIASCRSGNESSLTRDGVKPEKLSGEFKFTEGPAADSDGNVFFTDQPNDRIMKWSTDGRLSTWMQPSGRANGLYFDNDGNLWACADEKNEMWVINKNKGIEVVLSDYEGNKFNGPNDVWVTADGSAYFSDPFYKRPWWDRDTSQMAGQFVYYLPADKSEAVPVVEDLMQPNGIIGTPDQKILYVADIKDDKTYSYSIGAGGTLSNKKLFCEMGSDGMTLDEKGNLYLTNAGGVFIFDPAGNLIENIKIEEPWTANVCFGGANMDELFVTASSGFYRIPMKVKGAGSR